MNAQDLWELTPEQFNEWRRQHDYPVIWGLLESSLPYFSDWLSQQQLEKEIIFRLGIARFISATDPLSLCLYKSDDRWRLHGTGSTMLASLRKSGLIASERTFLPYLLWFRGQYGDKAANQIRQLLTITTNGRGEALVLGQHPLLNIGGVELSEPVVSGRLLDFTSMDDLVLRGAINNSPIYLWHCSAKGMQIHGGVSGLDFFDTFLWDHRNGSQKRELALIDGIFQDCRFECRDLRFHSSRAVLKYFEVYGEFFDATLEHTSLEEIAIQYRPHGKPNYSDASRYYRNAKRLLSSVGNVVEAGEYYYLEKQCEMKAYRTPGALYKETWLRQSLPRKWLTSSYCWLRYLAKLTSYVTWGFGERPERSLFISLGVILAATLAYFASPSSTTYLHAGRSLYFSIVTFVTLGYGDISQTSTWLELLSACEALSGMVLMGLFLAGFASKTKQY
ncbi:potassium channel family protein [Aeromonas simiae]|uniref:potassium channel family protein n=1 Tax=Aeromonas simiae TaxID=218936 RepID=UPI00266B4339|nr:potassium channel family protein [Aeromonas simiae]MDO2950959.1 potassium channel family protein [Aeromonas simiae]